jgi:large subunit ribosomal protein L9
MEIILREDVGRLGKSGQVLKVKDGYARNFLIPKGLALKATSDNLKRVEEEKKIKAIRKDREKREAQTLAEKLASISCTISVEVQEDGTLYGSVTGADIASALESDGFKIDKKTVLLDEPIRELGIYRVRMRLYPEVTTELKVWVVKR